jgi:uncharacterized protein (TIGR04222 family)
MNPLNWTAFPFLLFYILFAGTILLIIFWWRTHLGGGNRYYDLNRLAPLAIAYLAGGHRRAADTALAGLFEAGLIRTKRRGKQFFAQDQALIPATLAPYAKSVSGEGKRTKFHRAVRHANQQLHAELAMRGLVPGQNTVLGFQLFTGLLLATAVMLGIAKIIIGTARGHPAGYLVALVTATIFFGILLLQGPLRTEAGSQALRTFKRANARAARAPRGEELLLAVALTGPIVLAGLDYYDVFRSSTSGSNGQSGCGGGGGGGCGGGCGGCGG